MMGILYNEKGRPNMARKYSAVPKVQKLRDLNQLQAKSNKPKNFRTMEKDFVNKSNEQPASSKDQNLSNEHSDKLYYELVEFLLDNKVFWFTNKVLSDEYMKDTASKTYMMTKVRCLLAQHEGQEAVHFAD